MLDPGSDVSHTNAAAEVATAAAGRCDIAALIARYHADVYRYAFRLAGNVVDAEDLTQQAFLVAHQRLHQLREPDKADRWLFAIVRSCYLKSRRRERPVAAASLELDIDNIPERVDDDSEIDSQRLQLALNELPDEFRLVLVMFYFEDCSYQEIAEQLEIPPGTVMSRLSRAKGHLRKLLTRRAADDNAPPPVRQSPVAR